MALDKKKLEDVAYAGFNVENLEVIERQLRKIVNALRRKEYREAGNTAAALEARANGLTAQCYRFANRKESTGDAPCK